MQPETLALRAAIGSSATAVTFHKNKALPGRIAADVLLSMIIPCWGWLGGIAMMGRGDTLRGNIMVVAGIAGLFGYLWIAQSR